MNYSHNENGVFCRRFQITKSNRTINPHDAVNNMYDTRNDNNTDGKAFRCIWFTKSFMVLDVFPNEHA